MLITSIRDRSSPAVLVSVQLAAALPRLPQPRRDSLEDLQCSAVWLRPAAARSLSTRRVYPGLHLESSPPPPCPPLHCSLQAALVPAPMSGRPRRPRGAWAACLIARQALTPACPAADMEKCAHPHVSDVTLPLAARRHGAGGVHVAGGVVPLSLLLLLLKRDVPSGRPPADWRQ